MIGQQIADIALKYVGETEKPNNSGFNDADFEKRMKETGWVKGASWCAYFCELVWKEAYKSSPETVALDKLFSGSATANYKNFDLAHGWEVGQTPKIGALSVWRHGNGWQGHIGIVTGIGQNGAYNTIEGNTNDVGGREGYIVAKKTRHLNQPYSATGLNLIGFVYPKEI